MKGTARKEEKQTVDPEGQFRNQGQSNLSTFHVLPEVAIAAAPQTVILSVVLPVYNCASTVSKTVSNIVMVLDRLEETFKSIQEMGSLENNQGTSYATVSTLTPAFQSGDYSNMRTDFQREGRPYQKNFDWYELIIVNDGSSDETRAAARELSKCDKRVKLISYNKNMGKGYAVRQGVIHSQGKYLLFMDGDGNISSDILAQYIQKLDKVDVAIGSKYHRDSNISVPMSRKLLSKSFQMLVKIMLGLKISDTQVGLKAGKGESFRKIFQQMHVKRYAFDVEMLAVAASLGLKIEEMPVQLRIDSQFRAKEMARMAIDLVTIAYRTRISKFYTNSMARDDNQYLRQN
jgi:dolichol-phosphate mannosyltransferase